MARIEQNFKAERQAIQEKNSNLKHKFEKMERQIAQNKEERKIYQLKHREIEELKKQDNDENLACIKNTRFEQNCSIVEKHLALTILN